MAKVLKRGLVLAVGLAFLAVLGEAAYRLKLGYGGTRQAPPGSVFEIYGVGESTLVGEPFDPKVSVPRMLEHMCGGEITGRTIVVKNLAERGSPLYPQFVAFERAVAARDPQVPGVVLIMSGHNEGIPPGAPDAAPLSLLSRVAEESALLGDAVLALRRRRLISREKSLATYEYYLRRVIETAQQNGLVPILATMASNISRIEPNWDAAAGDAVGKLLARGIQLEEQAAVAAARDLYRDGIAAHAHSAAVLYYRAGRCEEALGNFAAAHDDFWTAVDLDPRTMFGRTTRAQNELLRRLAREYDIPLVDAVSLFEAHSPHGLLGDELFLDGQHPTIEGYRLLANAYAQILAERFGARITYPLPDEPAVVAALGYEARDVPNALVDAGSWLIATAVDHPFPRDRMALAAKRFTSLIGAGDDFSAWLGIALTQAALRGGGLHSSDDGLAIVGAYTKSYHILPAEFPTLLVRLQQYGVDGDIIDRLKELHRSSTAARNSDDWVARVAEIPGVPAD
jgi:tetratricopeptide (TPR) repeat protein